MLFRSSYGISQGEEIRIGLQLAQEDLAQLLGASRQRVNQELKELEREGVLRVEPTRLVVLSGYIDEALVERHRPDAVVAKPCSPETLIAAASGLE